MGEEDILTATWWVGTGSHVLPGFPSSQQNAEALNSKAKRDIQGLSQSTHTDVAKSLMQMVDVWSSPLKSGEETLDGSKYSLSAPLANLTTHRPVLPDMWMLTEKSGQWVHPGFKNTRLPGLPLLVPLLRQRSSRYLYRHEAASGRFFFVMAIQRPQIITPELGRRMVRYLQLRDCRTLTSMFVEDGVLERVENAQAPLRFRLKPYSELWGKYCVVIRQPNEAVVECTCGCYRWRGFCPHHLAIEEVEGLATRMPAPIPEAAAVEGSDSEAPPLSQKRRRR